MCAPLKKGVLFSKKAILKKLHQLSSHKSLKKEEFTDARCTCHATRVEKQERLASDPFRVSCFERVGWSLTAWKKDENSPKGSCLKHDDAQCCLTFSDHF